MSFNIYFIDNLNKIEHGEIIYNHSNYSLNNYSLLWNFWFLELYVQNINIDIDLFILFNDTINYIYKNYKSLLLYIRKYSINLTIFMIKILQKIFLSNKYIFKIKFKLNDELKVLKLLNNYFKKICTL